MRNPTRAFLREALRAKDYGLFKTLHGYVYLRWPYKYIAAALFLLHPPRWVDRLGGFLQRLFCGVGKTENGGLSFSDTYHAKVAPAQTAKKLIKVERALDQTLPEKILPFATARDLLLRPGQPIAALDCPCRSARPNPCLPLGVCLVLGEPFVSFIVEKHPTRARPISQQEALDILDAEQRRGHVSHAFFKDAMFGRFFAICNCCPCCCVAMEAQRAGSKLLAPSGYCAEIDAETCQHCAACVKKCPFGAVRMEAGRCVVDREQCMGCGVCEAACKTQAIRLVKDASKGEPLEI